MTSLLPVILALLLGAFLLHRFLQKQRRMKAVPLRLFADVQSLYESAEVRPGLSVGSWTLTGSRRGHVFQVGVVTDTLATRKLPVLWLMVTLPVPQELTQTFDLMLRASGPSTFSNFDFLPVTVPLPPAFPAEAIIRSELAGTYPEDVVRPHLRWFEAMRGKEILLSPKGLRLVLTAAQADRARYGVLRQAEFGDVVLDRVVVAAAMDVLLDMSSKLNP